jgi:hypothetical protein
MNTLTAASPAPSVFVPGSSREGDYIRTYTGRKFWPLSPQPEEVAIEDIAHALANSCRWTGHVKRFYSVGQHSLFCEAWVSGCTPATRLQALMHDASEAYIADIAKPIKPHMPQYRTIEARLMEVIAQALGFPWPMGEEVHRVDAFALAVECYHLMPPGSFPSDLMGFVPDIATRALIEQIELPVLSATTVEEIFVLNYRELYGHTVQNS